ncbi:MAG TPA: hypothetical protein DEA08_37040, partial [Planctomycetes bacterium]|nr:hypothetical protein [Planctomycetota bacterium]
MGVVLLAAWRVTAEVWLGWGLWLFLVGVGAGAGLLFAIVERLGRRSRVLAFVVGAAAAPAVFFGGALLVELWAQGSPLKAYGALAGSLGLGVLPQLGLFLAGALSGHGALLLARWRGASLPAQVYAMTGGSAAFVLIALTLPLRYEALNAAFYLLPLLTRAVVFPLSCWAGERAIERLRRGPASVPRSAKRSGGVDPRARHKARWCEKQAKAHEEAGRAVEAAASYAQAAEVWPSAERSLLAASAYARADEPYRAIEHLQRMLADPAHDPRAVARPEFDYLRTLEAWAEVPRPSGRRRPRRPQRSSSAPWLHLLASCGLAVLAGWSLSFAWTLEVPAEVTRRLVWSRLTRDAELQLELARRLERGTSKPPATIVAESSYLPAALLHSGAPPPSGQSLVAAEKAYLGAARGGSVPAMLRVVELLDGLMPPRLASQAYWLRQAAESGSPEALWRYAVMLHTGEGVTRDEAAALSHCRSAATQGHVEAMFTLASWLETGSGTSEPDPAEAARWYQAASDAGHLTASLELSRLKRGYPDLIIYTQLHSTSILI